MKQSSPSSCSLLAFTFNLVFKIYKKRVVAVISDAIMVISLFFLKFNLKINLSFF